MITNGRVDSGVRLGFIGLGYLGSRIARRLLAAGYPLVVYNRDPVKSSELAMLGAEVAPDPAALARSVDVVLSCLADGFAVEAVYFKGKVLRSARPGARIIEMSTVSPDTSRRLHWAAREYGLSMLDVTVSGSTVAAEAGTLTLFGGGEQEAFRSVEAIFPAIAKQWFYMGPSGSGVAMKLVVNTLLGVGMQAIAEAVALGSGLGLARELLFDTLARTAVVAPAHVGKLATARHNDYSAQFPVRLMYKDFGLVLAAADRLRLTMPATESAAAVTSDEASNGREEDFSAVIRRMEQEAGATFPPAA